MKWPQNSLFFFICILRNLGDHHNYFSFFLDVFILCCKCLCWCLYLKNFNMHCHLWQPNMLLCQIVSRQKVTIWRDTRCCLAKTGAKTPKLGTVGKKGRFWLFLYNPHLVILPILSFYILKQFLTRNYLKKPKP